MIIGNSVAKIQGRLFGSRTVITYGTGSVIHSRPDKAILMTAAHVINGLTGAPSLSWQDIQTARREMEFEVNFPGVADSFRGEYLCVPEWEYPDIGLIEIQGLRGNIFPAIPISTNDFKIGIVKVFGYPQGVFTQQEVRRPIARFYSGEKFPELEFAGDVPFGFSGGPLIMDDEIVGIVKSSRPEGSGVNTLGVHSIGIRRMLTNWAAGKYISFPYNVWEERGLLDSGLPPITELPIDIRSQLGTI